MHDMVMSYTKCMDYSHTGWRGVTQLGQAWGIPKQVIVIADVKVPRVRVWGERVAGQGDAARSCGIAEDSAAAAECTCTCACWRELRRVPAGIGGYR